MSFISSLYLLVARLGGILRCGTCLRSTPSTAIASGWKRQRIASGSQLIATAVRDRWVWIAPMWATACVLVTDADSHQSRAANVFMYRFF